MQKVAAALMTNPDERHYGYTVCRSAKMRSGVAYPILHRMLEAGWLSDGWEHPRGYDGTGRPPRRYYEVTELGRKELAAALEGAK